MLTWFLLFVLKTQKYISFVIYASYPEQITQKTSSSPMQKADAEAKIAVTEQQLAGLRK